MIVQLIPINTIVVTLVLNSAIREDVLKLLRRNRVGPRPVGSDGTTTRATALRMNVIRVSRVQAVEGR